MSQERKVYDEIADAYKSSKTLSFRKYIEEYTLFKIAGSFYNSEVLDLACGEGFYTRKIKRAGAKIALGIDISTEMIRLAKEQEKEFPIGCSYLIEDVSKIEIKNQFDSVTAMYLLNYAKSKESLLLFCKVAFNALRPGGVFIGVNDNVASDPSVTPSFKKYGFTKQSTTPQKEGDPVKYTITNEDGTEFTFDNYFLKPSTYEWAFKQAGFSTFSWEGPYLHPDQKENAFWNDFIIYSPIIGFKATKLM